jgi:hypothetical protein
MTLHKVFSTQKMASSGSSSGARQQKAILLGRCPLCSIRRFAPANSLISALAFYANERARERCEFLFSK